MLFYIKKKLLLTNILSIAKKMEKQLNLQFQEISDEEIPDVNDEEDKDNNLKRKGNDMAERFNKKPIEVDIEENTMQNKSFSKKAKKEVKNS
ncbi:hypothetical protein Glove_515g9 [Diversispora epigaea]|uniref:Uncharacterized protein n=1 Tax=Diversispora epigaea TaxID=1348612 RepID=A0A397GJ91_9GLOM|nr:hypothetical protein Glove_515g9 [Diversispora epigaea]